MSNLIGYTSYNEEHSLIKKYIEEGKLEKALQRLEGLISEKNLSDEEKVGIQILLSLTLVKKGQVDKGKSLAEKMLKTSKLSDNSLFIIDSTITLADALWRGGKPSESLDLIEKAQPYLSKLGYVNIVDITERNADLLNIKGVAYWLMGESQLSLENFQQSLNLRGKAGNKRDFAICLNNIGNIYVYKGELDLGLEHHLQTLEIRKNFGNIRDISSSLGNIAEIYQYKGNFTLSLDYYIQAKSKFKEIKNFVYLARTIYQMITLYVEHDSFNEAENALTELAQIRNSNENAFISLLYRMSEAVLLKSSNRLMDKFKAGLLFDEIIKEKIIDHEISVKASLHFCDILLLELRISGNEDVFKVVKKISTRLYKIADEQKSYSLTVQSYLLESKLALIDFNIKKAQELLTQAQEIAEKKGLQKLAFLVSSELDNLLNQIPKWEELIQRKAEIVERLELTRLEDSILQLIRKREEQIPEVIQEEPVLFLIIKEEGVTLFSYQ
ncbi:MAG: tetratricopeptide repeat protein, partial [Candidatus Hodarchaeales archaeon]